MKTETIERNLNMKLAWFKLLVVGLGLAVFSATATTFYVNVNNPAPASPFTNWLTAATNIQDAIDVSTDGDLILVTNGVYATGGRVVYGTLTNRVVINKAVTVRSVNGPAVTIIQGFQDSLNGNSYINPQLYYLNNVRCVYMTNNAVLDGFTITNGATRAFNVITNTTVGGGIYCESMNSVITNCYFVGNLNPNYYAGGGAGVYRGTLNSCILSNNLIPFYGPFGGAAYQSVLNNCLIISNAADFGGGAALSVLNQCLVIGNYTPVGSVPYGGGLYSCTANNCLIAGNYCAGVGGGAFDSSLFNCTVVSNTALSYGSGLYFGSINNIASNSIIYYNANSARGGNIYKPINTTQIYYCCTIPTTGISCVTNTPAFVNLAGGDFHLSSNSPCINAGNNSFVFGTNDLDGNPRIVGGTVDIGCYEYQSPASVLSYAWAQQYCLPTDGSADFIDSDGTGMNNWQKWIAGLNPTNPASILAMSSAVAGTNYTGLKVTWQSVNTRSYYLQRSSDLTQPFSVLQSNLVGQTGTTTYNDTSATNAVPYFYRVGVQ